VSRGNSLTTRHSVPDTRNLFSPLVPRYFALGVGRLLLNFYDLKPDTSALPSDHCSLITAHSFCNCHPARPSSAVQLSPPTGQKT
jgi:hypothetical protein